MTFKDIYKVIDAGTAVIVHAGKIRENIRTYQEAKKYFPCEVIKVSTVNLGNLHIIISP